MSNYTGSQASVPASVRLDEDGRRRQKEIDWEVGLDRDHHTFYVIWVLAQLMGAIACVMIGLWTGLHGPEDGRDNGGHRNVITHQIGAPNISGYGWYKNPDKMFNVHPLMMVLSLVWLNAQAMMLYRTFYCFNPDKFKYMHAITHMVVFAGMVVGLHAIFRYKRFNNLAHLNSTHGWMGIVTVVLFTAQLVVASGIFNIIYSVSKHVQVWYTSIHNYMGVTIFVMACVTAFCGMAEGQTYGFSRAGVFCKIFVIALFFFVMFVTFLVGTERNKRPGTHRDTEPDDKAELSSIAHQPYINHSYGSH